MIAPHTKVVDELLCVFSLLISVTPEEGGYLWQVHRVLKSKKELWTRESFWNKDL